MFRGIVDLAGSHTDFEISFGFAILKVIRSNLVVGRRVVVQWDRMVVPFRGSFGRTLLV